MSMGFPALHVHKPPTEWRQALMHMREEIHWTRVDVDMGIVNAGRVLKRLADCMDALTFALQKELGKDVIDVPDPFGAVACEIEKMWVEDSQK